MFEKLLKKFGFAGREKLKEKLAATEHAPNYSARTQFFDEMLVNDLPLFTLRTAMLMMADPIVQIALQMRDAALMPGEINVECPNPAAKKFVQEQWKKLWALHAPKIIKTKLFGFSGFEPRYKINERTRLLEVANLRSFAPNDTRALRDTDAGLVVGFNLRRTASVAGMEQIYRPKALWATFDVRWGASYGTSILKRPYSPWYEKWMRHGAKKVQQLRMIKDSYVGDIFEYPYDRIITQPDGTILTWRDVTRELGENRLAGGVVTIPFLPNKEGVNQVKYTPPQDMGSPDGIFRWCEGLDDDICKALGVPPEVIQASETGSGFSGRSIPMAAFLQGCMVEFGDYVQAISHYVLLPLLWLNFGENVECTITPKPLIETFTADIGGSQVGGEAMGQRAPPQQQQGQQGQQPRIEDKRPAVERGPQQFREDSPDTRWITIGGKRGGDGEEHKGGHKPAKDDTDWSAVEFDEGKPAAKPIDPLEAIAGKGASAASRRVREAAARIREAVKKKR